jgi:lysophospholipase L1-like esterase
MTARFTFSNMMRPLATTLLLAAGFTAASTAMARSEYWEQRVSLFNQLPVEEEDIVFLGNSITDGGEFSELFSNYPVKNRGINSDDISGVLARLPQVTAGSPAKIFLLIGINDISHNLSLGQLTAKYTKLVQAIREQSPSTRLYIQSVMPINNDFGRYKNLKGKEKIITDLNKELMKIAVENDAVYVDLWPALAEPDSGRLRPDFTNDGLHLLGEGYKAWAETISGYVIE